MRRLASSFLLFAFIATTAGRPIPATNIDEGMVPATASINTAELNNAFMIHSSLPLIAPITVPEADIDSINTTPSIEAETDSNTAIECNYDNVAASTIATDALDCPATDTESELYYYEVLPRYTLDCPKCEAAFTYIFFIVGGIVAFPVAIFLLVVILDLLVSWCLHLWRLLVSIFTALMEWWMGLTLKKRAAQLWKRVLPWKQTSGEQAVGGTAAPSPYACSTFHLNGDEEDIWSDTYGTEMPPMYTERDGALEGLPAYTVLDEEPPRYH